MCNPTREHLRIEKARVTYIGLVRDKIIDGKNRQVSIEEGESMGPESSLYTPNGLNVTYPRPETDNDLWLLPLWTRTFLP